MKCTYCMTEHINFGSSLTENPDTKNFRRHCHQKYEILFIAHGRGKCIVEGSEYPLSGGELFILRPFEYHYVCIDVSEPYERFVINFSDDVLMDAVRELPMLKRKSHGIYFCTEEAKNNFYNVVSLVRSFSENVDPKSEQSEAMSSAAINQLLLLLLHDGAEQPESFANKLVADIIEYLNTNICEHLSLEETAKRFFISKYYLCRIFKRHTGISVFSYLNSKKIALAQKLISSGEPPTAVAYAVGFRDYSSFYRAYVKETGNPPSERKSRA